MLSFDPNWRFSPPSQVPFSAVNAVEALISRVALTGNEQGLLEHFKQFFAAAAGTTAHTSSSVSWARSDLNDLMREAASNAPLFLEALYDALDTVGSKSPGVATPELAFVNRLLRENGVDYEISPPHLRALRSFEAGPGSIEAPSLDVQAVEIIMKSWADADRMLNSGQPRQAVQENLWLLETVVTAFKGRHNDGTSIQGKYFNKIADELRKSSKNNTLVQVIGWIGALHGYLSSPTGGGVRHGADVSSMAPMDEIEGRLYCHLIRSYISYLLAEYERLRAI